MAGIAKNFGVFWQKINGGLTTISYLVLLFQTFFIGVDVFARYFFSMPIRGGVEITGLLMSFLVYFSITATLVVGRHVQVSIITSRFNPRLKFYDNIFVNSVGFLFLGFLSIASAKLFWASWTTNEVVLSALTLPIWPSQLALLIGSCVMAIQFLICLLTSLVGTPAR